jgi:hypothetical protein
MEIEPFPDGFEELDLMDAADINPRHGAIVRQSELARIRDHLLFAPVAGIDEQRNLDGSLLLLPDVDQRTGRQSRLLRSFLNQFHGHPLVRKFSDAVKSGTMQASFFSASRLVTLYP